MLASAGSDSPAPAPSVALVVPKDYVPGPESEHALYQVDVEGFCGPLDLLLFLIRRHRIDIFNIPMAFICARYVDCLGNLSFVDVDVAAEFMFVASELLHIKSRLLLPAPAKEGGDAEDALEDPRQDLVRRLLAYEQLQQGAQFLGARAHLGFDVFARNSERFERPPSALKATPLFALGQSLCKLQARREKAPAVHQVQIETVSIRERMLFLVDLLQAAAKQPLRQCLQSGNSPLLVVVTFLAVLEMTRLKLLHLNVDEEGQVEISPRYPSAQEATAQIAALNDPFAG